MKPRKRIMKSFFLPNLYLRVHSIESQAANYFERQLFFVSFFIHLAVLLVIMNYCKSPVLHWEAQKFPFYVQFWFQSGSFFLVIYPIVFSCARAVDCVSPLVSGPCCSRLLNSKRKAINMATSSAHIYSSLFCLIFVDIRTQNRLLWYMTVYCTLAIIDPASNNYSSCKTDLSVTRIHSTFV